MKKLLLLGLLFLITLVNAQDSIINPEYDYCRDIKTHKDKFNGKIKSQSPEIRAVSFYKENSRIYMTITVWYGGYSYQEKGVIILLSGGKRITKPNVEIDVDDYSDGYYSHTAYFQLTADDIEKLKKYRITDYRLYQYDGVADVYDGEMYRRYMLCLAPAKSPATKKKKRK